MSTEADIVDYLKEYHKKARLSRVGACVSFSICIVNR